MGHLLRKRPQLSYVVGYAPLPAPLFQTPELFPNAEFLPSLNGPNTNRRTPDIPFRHDLTTPTLKSRRRHDPHQFPQSSRP